MFEEGLLLFLILIGVAPAAYLAWAIDLATVGSLTYLAACFCTSQIAILSGCVLGYLIVNMLDGRKGD